MVDVSSRSPKLDRRTSLNVCTPRSLCRDARLCGVAQGDLVQVGLVVSQLSTSDEWISVQPWYGSPEYAAWRSRSNLAARGDFTETFMPYTTLEVGSGVLPCDCSFPTAAAIRDRGLDLKLCLTGPARVRYVIMQEPLPPGVLPPTLAEVNALEVT